MFAKRFFYVSAALSSLAGCAAPLAIMHHPSTQPVAFQGVEFRVLSSTFRSTIQRIGEESTPQATFLVIELSMTNLRKTPITSTFHPVFRLVDDRGAEYAPSKEQTIEMNESLNPGVMTKHKIVFDVPVASTPCRSWFLTQLPLVYWARARSEGSTSSTTCRSRGARRTPLPVWSPSRRPQKRRRIPRRGRRGGLARGSRSDSFPNGGRAARRGPCERESLASRKLLGRERLGAADDHPVGTTPVQQSTFGSVKVRYR